ncbi:MAG: hypothetical protein KF715_09140 [Candidatus Didemnitutus sp.]|nr:hypothetical protein [Candidatus Didemnitutus sp.]
MSVPTISPAFERATARGFRVQFLSPLMRPTPLPQARGKRRTILLTLGCLPLLLVSLAAATERESPVVLRGTLSDQYLVKEERRYEAPFELVASAGEFRIRSLDPETKPPLAQLFASDYRSSYLSTLWVKDGAPDEKSAMATLRYGIPLKSISPRMGFLVWMWLASRLPASGEYDRQFLDLAPPTIATQRPERQRATLVPEIVRDRNERVTGVRLWANLGETKPARLEPSGMMYLAAELSFTVDSAGRPREASLVVHALRPRGEHATRLRTEVVRRLAFRADTVPLDRPEALRRATFLADRDPPAVFVHDYRFPDESVRGFRSYRIEAGQPIPFDPSKAPAENANP